MIFLNFDMLLENYMQVLGDRAGFLEKKLLPPKLGKRTKICQKQGFHNLLKNFVINFYWICCILNIYIICCVPAQIPYLGKFLFQRKGPKCFQAVRLQDFLINHISRTNHWNSLIFCMLIQIHVNSKLIKNVLGGHCQKWV